MTQNALKNRQLLAYSSGSLGTGIFSTVPSILLLYFMTDILGIPAQLAALGIFIPKLWDMITDPLIGFISDKTKSRWGRRRPYLFAGSFLMPLSFVFVFLVPDFKDPIHSFYFVLGSFILSATAYTIFAVPYVAMPAEMSDDPEERTKIISYRMTAVMIGILFGAALAPLLVDHFGGGKTGYAYMGITFSLICFSGMLITSFSSKNLPLSDGQKGALPFSRQLRLVCENRPFLILLGVYLLQLIGVGTFTSLVPYLVVHVLTESQSYIGILFLLSLGVSTLTIPFWSVVSAKLGKLPAYKLAAYIYAVSLASLFMAGSYSYVPELGMVMLGFGFAGLQVLPYSILTDVIRNDAVNTGASREGILTGIWTACEKTGLALGPLVAGTLLALFGFVESSGQGHVAQQADTTLNGILISISFVPAVLVFISTSFMKYAGLPISANQIIETKR